MATGVAGLNGVHAMLPSKQEGPVSVIIPPQWTVASPVKVDVKKRRTVMSLYSQTGNKIVDQKISIVNGAELWSPPEWPCDCQGETADNSPVWTSVGVARRRKLLKILAASFKFEFIHCLFLENGWCITCWSMPIDLLCCFAWLLDQSNRKLVWFHSWEFTFFIFWCHILFS